ncbi:ATP-dependent Clp protease ATP-binding subunit [Candidatus Aerophobetes bacterium]|uniref:ATP-dependent Clp protease ATP-binding subunit n=1 Tax=Aerophobetes bacterium TaxID=2030807 RepID=A0A523W432_UNCAE|nr:MAG: ATP-dependent Clp protease ATP-binding subunit [Candidatus Aerophobetes bacterium]
MFEKLSDKARKILLLAQQKAGRSGYSHISSGHLLLALLEDADLSRVFESSGADIQILQRTLEADPAQGEGRSLFDETPLTLEARKVFEIAALEAKRGERNYIGAADILMGLVQVPGAASRALAASGLDPNSLRKEVSTLEDGDPQGSSKSTRTPALDKLSRDLTKLAREGKLDPVIGREREAERMIHILSRKTKNNPVLIGEAGVGKTAVVEGLAQKIVQGQVPDNLKGKRLLALSLGGAVAGTKYRGEFEKRIQKVISEVTSSGDVILFVDELHTLVGAGAAEGAIDASNILKPALAKGEIQCIGATTLDEYRKYVEKDKALERRFQPITVGEPTVEETVEILEGLRERYEEYHGVKITREAIEAAARLSDRYIQERFLPDKAIDVMDEAGARTRIGKTSSFLNTDRIKEELERIRGEKQKAVENEEFEKAATLKEREGKLEGKMKGSPDKKGSTPKVSPEDVAYIVSSWTGIPVTEMTRTETSKLLNMERELHRRIVGQNEAVRIISQSIRRARAGVKNMKRPIGCFMFLGPTGVGKTQLARSLAQFLFGSEEAIVRLDMSEYMERFSVSRLTGAPPGYVGYQEGGELTEKIRRNPYSVVLLDEIEKAHPDVFNVLLQMMEDGRLSDNLGHRVDFRNTILIMTSNLGAREITADSKLGFSPGEKEALSYEEIREKVTSALKRHFRPEFLNRLDEVIVFRSLTRDDMVEIVDIMIEEETKTLAESGINFEITDKAKRRIAEEGYDPDFGARPLRRAIQRLIENPLSEEILRGTLKRGDRVVADLKDNSIVFVKKEKAHPATALA